MTQTAAAQSIPWYNYNHAVRDGVDAELVRRRYSKSKIQDLPPPECEFRGRLSRCSGTLDAPRANVGRREHRVHWLRLSL
jgi:hypothetical protein